MIERAIAASDWPRARRLIREELKNRDDHWLLTRLSLTYYEQKQYRKSLQYVTEALHSTVLSARGLGLRWNAGHVETKKEGASDL